ncbi:MAG: CAP domain-containing protein [Acidobacteria bacterium]|nr:CAP domain-containing protein [Acidobacteriota bacterium]
MKMPPSMVPSQADPLLSDDPYYAARQAVVQKINADRQAAGISPVEFDPLSSQVSDQHCQEMAGNEYLSHWNLRGLLPYHRYHFAGGRDHVQENLSRMTVISAEPNPISAAPQDVQVNMLNAHQRFVDEKPPVDGHRKNVLDPRHTHVGIGLAVAGREFTMAEEFINRYAELARLPELLPNGSVRIEGTVHHKEYGPYYCVLFYEGWPQPRTVEELNRTYAYEDMTGQVAGRVAPWDMSFNSSSGRFRFNLPIRVAGPGYYHMVLWVRRPIRSIPYVLGSPGAYQVDTANGVVCAGWVFRAGP